MIKYINTIDIKNLYELYEPIKENFSNFLEVGIHKIYYEETGNPNGIPIVYVHGGPGGANPIFSRKFFNPEKYRIITIDQRGAGRSLPFATFESNTTIDLVEDMEKIRKRLNIDKWILFGGSWGTTVSLCYAIKYPQNVSSMILRGIFLSRESDINWLYEEGASYIFPKEHEKFKKAVSTKSIIEGYYEKFNNDNYEIVKKYAKLWSDWEYSCVTLYPLQRPLEITDYDISLAKLECHYFYNKSFIPENYILNNIDKIKDIKTYIVHGRYDIDCRISGAYELYKKLNNAIFYIINDAGHSSIEKGIKHTLIDILEKEY